MAPDIRYMTIEEVADLLGVTYQLIYRLVRSGEMPAVRIGRVYRITPTDLDRYLEKTRTAATEAGSRCSACGKTYHSSLSMKGECETCGEPICADCWDREGARTCGKHAVASRKGA